MPRLGDFFDSSPPSGDGDAHKLGDYFDVPVAQDEQLDSREERRTAANLRASSGPHPDLAPAPLEGISGGLEKTGDLLSGLFEGGGYAASLPERGLKAGFGSLLPGVGPVIGLGQDTGLLPKPTALTALGISRAMTEPTRTESALGLLGVAPPLFAQPVLGSLRGDPIGGAVSGFQQAGRRLAAGLGGIVDPDLGHEVMLEPEPDSQGMKLAESLGLSPKAGQSLDLLAEVGVPLGLERLGARLAPKQTETRTLGEPIVVDPALASAPDTPREPTVSGIVPDPEAAPPDVLRSGDYAPKTYSDPGIPPGPETIVRPTETEGFAPSQEVIEPPDFETERGWSGEPPLPVTPIPARSLVDDIRHAKEQLAQGMSASIEKQAPRPAPRRLNALEDPISEILNRRSQAEADMQLEFGEKSAPHPVTDIKPPIGWSGLKEALLPKFRKGISSGESMGSGPFNVLEWSDSPIAKQVRAQLAERGIRTADAAAEALVKAGYHPGYAQAIAEHFYPTGPQSGPVLPPRDQKPPAGQGQPAGGLAALPDLLKGAAKSRAQTERAYTAERAQRFAAFGSALKEGGEAGATKALAHLAGELPKDRFEPIRSALSQGEVDELYNRVAKAKVGTGKTLRDMSEGDKAHGITGLKKLLDPRYLVAPTASELNVLNHVLPSGAVEALLDKRSGGMKATDLVVKLLTLHKEIQTGFDASFFGRQGRGLWHTPEFWKAVPAARKAFGDHETYRSIYDSVVKDPIHKLFVDTGGTTPPPIPKERASFREWLKQPLDLEAMSQLEEGRQSSGAETLPVVGRLARAGNRANDLLLLKARQDRLASVKKAYERAGIPLSMDQLKDLNGTIHSLSGRGSFSSIPFGVGAKLDAATPLANMAFWSSKLIKSRIDMLNPTRYLMPERFGGLSKPARIEQWKGLIGLAASTYGLMQLSKAASHLLGKKVDVDTDTSNVGADFFKAKVGNTRFDLAGGYSQLFRLLAQMQTGKYKDSNGAVHIIGEGKNRTNADLVGQYLRNKLSFVPSLAVDELSGKDAVGNDLDAGVIAERANNMNVDDVYEAYKDYNSGAGSLPVLGAVAAGGFAGIGSQTYTAGGPLGAIEMKARRGDPSWASDANKLVMAGKIKRSAVDRLKTRLKSDKQWADFSALSANDLAATIKTLEPKEAERFKPLLQAKILRPEIQELKSKAKNGYATALDLDILRDKIRLRAELTRKMLVPDVDDSE